MTKTPEPTQEQVEAAKKLHHAIEITARWEDEESVLLAFIQARDASHEREKAELREYIIGSKQTIQANIVLREQAEEKLAQALSERDENARSRAYCRDQEEQQRKRAEQAEAKLAQETERHDFTVTKWMRERKELTDALVEARGKLSSFTQPPEDPMVAEALDWFSYDADASDCGGCGTGDQGHVLAAALRASEAKRREAEKMSEDAFSETLAMDRRRREAEARVKELEAMDAYGEELLSALKPWKEAVLSSEHLLSEMIDKVHNCWIKRIDSVIGRCRKALLSSPAAVPSEKKP